MKRGKVIRSVISFLLCLTMITSASAGTIILPKNLKVVGDEAFFGDTSLTEVIVPGSVEQIGDQAFAESGLNEITLPDSLESIGSNALGDGDVQVNANPGSAAFDWAVENGFIDGSEFTPHLKNIYIQITRSETSNFHQLFIEASCDHFVYPDRYNPDDLKKNLKVYVGKTKDKGKATIISDYGSGYSGGYNSEYDFSIIKSIDPEKAAYYIWIDVDNGVRSISYGPVLINVATRSIDGEMSIVFHPIDSNSCSIDIYSQGYIYEMHSKYYRIPEKGDHGESVVAVDNGFSNIYVQYLTIPNSVTRVDGISHCEELVGVAVPASVTEIGYFAFSDNPKLEKIYCVKPSAAWTWFSDNGFSSMLIPWDGVTDPFNSQAEEEISPRDWFEFEENEYDNLVLKKYIGPADNLNDIIIPAEVEGKQVTAIGDNAFYEQNGLIGKLIIPDGIRTIGEYAFYRCYGLDGNLTIPDSVVEIGQNAFNQCSNFDKLTLSKNLTRIEDSTFVYCNSFKGDLVIPEGIISIGNNAFTNGFSGRLILPESLKEIGNSAFSWCGFKYNLVLPSHLESIGNAAFVHCDGFVGSLVIPDSVTYIGQSAFSDCTGFTGKLILPNELGTIEYNTYSNCSRLSGSLVIPQTVTNIHDSAFSGCTGFDGDLYIPSSNTNIWSYSYDVFANTGFRYIYCQRESAIWKWFKENGFADKLRAWNGNMPSQSDTAISGIITTDSGEPVSDAVIRGINVDDPEDIRLAYSETDGTWVLYTKKNAEYRIEYDHYNYIITGTEFSARPGDILTATAILPGMEIEQFITFDSGSGCEFIGSGEEVTSTKENGEIVSRTNYPLVAGTELSIPFRTSSDATKVTVKLRYWNEGYQNWYTFITNGVETAASTAEFREDENGKSGILKLTLPEKANIPEGDYVLQIWSKNGANKTVDARVKIRIVYAKIEGTIITDTGEPVSGILVRAAGVEDPEDTGSTYSATDGTWSIGVNKDKLYTVDYQHSLFIIDSTENVKAGDKVTALAVAREFDIKYNNATVIGQYRYASVGTKQFSVECDGEIESVEVYVDGVFAQSQYADSIVRFALTEGIHTITFKIDGYDFTTHFAVFTSVSQTEMTVMKDDTVFYTWPARGYESTTKLARDSKVQVRGTVADTYYYVMADGREGFIKVEDATATDFTAPEGFTLRNEESQIRAGDIASFAIQYSEKTRYIRLRYDNNTAIYENDYWRTEEAPATIPDCAVTQIVEKNSTNGNIRYLFSRLISTPGKQENDYTRSIHASVSYDGRYWSEESAISVRVLPTADTPHSHLFADYYDSELNKHTYCVFCEPRTDDQLLEDSRNFARYIKNYAAQLAAENIFSIIDPTSQLLQIMRESNASLIKQAAQLAYNLASFSWSDAVKQFIPGSDAVDTVKKNCVQSAISRILNNQTMKQTKLDTAGIEMAQEIVSELNDLIETLRGILSENVLRELEAAKTLVEKGIRSNNYGTVALGFLTADDAWEIVRKYDLDLSEPNFISFKNEFSPGVLDYISLAVDVGIDWYEYAQWNDAQMELLTLCLSDARRNVALLEEIKSTYSADATVTAYCNEMIRNINNYVSNELWGSVCKAADTAGELTRILLENTMESAFNLAVNAGVNTLLKKLCGMKGGIVGIVGSGAGLLAELIAGTDTTAKNMDNVAIIYTDIESFVNKYYSVVHNSSSKSDECKAFGMIYVGEMKMAAVSWVGEIRKNEQKENCDKINASLEQRIKTIIEGID